MTGHLWLRQPASVPAPGDVTAYLRQQGWSLEKTTGQWAEYAKEVEGRHVVVEVPQQAAAQDYPRAFGVLLEDLASIESRPASIVLRDLKASAIDIIRLAIDSTLTKDGRIPIEAGRRVYEASRDLVLSAGCAVIDPRPVFAKRKPDEAMKLLDRARFGRTEIGSFVLSIEFSVPPRLQESLLPNDGDPNAPFERRVSMKLAEALGETEAAARESTASGKIDPFTVRTKAGVSANLCDAVADMIEATTADTLTASFSFAVRRPLGVTVPQQVVFASDSASILRAASAGLRNEAMYPDTDVVGPVVKLDSIDPDRGGEAVVKAFLDGRYRSVRIALGPDVYRRAIEAHRNREVVRCIGELEREGRSLVLRNARDFGPVEDLDDA